MGYTMKHSGDNHPILPFLSVNMHAPTQNPGERKYARLHGHTRIISLNFKDSSATMNVPGDRASILYMDSTGHQPRH